VAPGYQPTVAEGIQFYTPASRPVIAQAVQRAIEQGEPFDVELELITARGNHRWVHSIGEVDRARGKVFGFFQDITERKQAEEALRRAEEKYRALFENALEGIYQTTPQGTFVAANPAVARILGYDAPEALMHDRPDIASHGYVDPQKREEFKRRIAAEGQIKGFEYEVYRRDGSMVWVSENARAVRDEQGQVVLYEGSFEDITARKVAEVELAEAKALLQTAMDCSPAGIAIADAPSGQLRYVNRAGLGIRGGTEAELVTGVDLNQYVASWQMLDLDGTPLAPEEVPLTWAIQKGEPYSREFIIRRAPGDERIVLGNAAPVLDASGKVLAGIVVFMDITARKRAEAAQRLSEARFAEFMAHLPAAVFIKDVFGRLLFANRYFLDLPGGPGQTRADRLLGGGAQPMSEDDLRVMVGHPLVGEECVTELGGISRVFQTIKFAILVPEQPAMLGGIALDITERKEAEAALRASESRTRGFLEFAVDGILEGAPDGTILEANACLCALVGMTREAVMGRTIRDLPFAPESVAQQPWRFDLLQRGEVVVRERKLIRPDGSTVVIEMRSKQMPNGNLQSIFHDITARKQAEEEIGRLALMVDTAPSAITAHDFDGRILYANQRACTLHGYRLEEFLALNLRQLDVPADVRLMAARMSALRAHGEPTFEVAHFRKDGTTLPLEVSAKLVTWGGQPAVLSVATDLTERQQAEAALRASEERLRLAMAAANMGTWDRDLATTALRWSETEERLMGFAPGTFPGTSAAFLALLHPDSEAVHLAAQQRVRTGDGVFHAELHFRCADGRERWGLLSGQKILDASGQAVRIIGVDMDITERKRLEAEHATLEGQMRHAERLKSIGTLASGVAHEINNPINGVLNYAQMLLDQAEPGSRPAEFATVILRESKRVIAIVRNLLQYSRQEPQPFSRVPVGELVEQSLSLLRAALRKDQIDLRVSVPADLPWLCCRGNQLQQVLVNLLTNARDALNQKYPGPDADKVLLLSAHTFQQADQPWLRFTVEDHGPGIPAALAERIFDPFFTTKQVDRGTGLGLSISHNLVQEHHGKLWVETEPGHWTRFHVDLPQEQTRKA
jgi:PAS domain S-box-containing protein